LIRQIFDSESSEDPARRPLLLSLNGACGIDGDRVSVVAALVGTEECPKQQIEPAYEPLHKRPASGCRGSCGGLLQI